MERAVSAVTVLGSSPSVLQVEKLMNRLLYNQYKLKKASVLQHSTQPVVERVLYHGTSEGSVKEICVHGFNRSFCGKNGTFTSSHPASVSFRRSGVSSRFSVPHSHGLRPGGVLRRQLGSVRPGPVFAPERRRLQVYFRLQSSDRRFHQGLPLDEDGASEGDRRYPPQIRQRD